MNTITGTVEIAEAAEYMTVTFTEDGEQFTDQIALADTGEIPTDADVDAALAEAAPFSASIGQHAWRRTSPVDGRSFTVEAS